MSGLPRLKHYVTAVNQGWSPQCYPWPTDGVEQWAVLKAGAANGGRFRPMENKQLPEEVTPRPAAVVQDGDLIVSRANTRELVGSAAVARGHYPRLMLSDKLYALRLDTQRAMPEYVALTLSTQAWRDLIALEASGSSQSMQNISQADILSLPMPLPALDVQHAVVQRVEGQTTRVDVLIDRQRQLISTLRERRTALIERVVGQGMDPQAPRKDSGMRWARSVPAHWKVANIRRFATMKTGHTPSRSVPAYWEDRHIPWLTLADVWQLRDDRLTHVAPDTAELISDLGLEHSAAELLPAGTVVLSRTASVGFSGVMPVAMATSQDYWNWICGPDLLPEYLTLLFRAMRRDILGLMVGSTHKTIYQGTAAGLTIPVPPLKEQRSIVDHLSHVTARIDNLIDTAEQFIDLAIERRSALITAAITEHTTRGQETQH